MELQNEVRALTDQMKLKVDSEEIESLHNLINELYEKIQGVEKATGTGSGETQQRPPTIPRMSVAGGSGSLGPRGNQTVKEITDQIQLLKEKVDEVTK